MKLKWDLKYSDEELLTLLRIFLLKSALGTSRRSKSETDKNRMLPEERSVGKRREKTSGSDPDLVR